MSALINPEWPGMLTTPSSHPLSSTLQTNSATGHAVLCKHMQCTASRPTLTWGHGPIWVDHSKPTPHVPTCSRMRRACSRRGLPMRSRGKALSGVFTSSASRRSYRKSMRLMPSCACRVTQCTGLRLLLTAC